MWEVMTQYTESWKMNHNKKYKKNGKPTDNMHVEYTPSYYVKYVNWRRYSEKWRKEFHYDEKQKYPKGWRQVKENILERDKHTCQICGRKRMNRAPHVHHIDYDKTNISEDNLITTCDSCHRETGGFKRDYWRTRCISIMIKKGYRLPGTEIPDTWKVKP